VARLEELGLVIRRAGFADRRMREAGITPQGSDGRGRCRRERMALTLFREWSRNDSDELLRLMRMLADGLNETPAAVG
jgi:hypothetical protein